MKKRKIVGSLATMLMAVPLVAGILGAPLTANAEEVKTKPTEINFTLHKRVWDGESDEKMPAPEQNSGLEMNFEGAGLDNVDFTLYDVTNIYYDALKDNPKTVEVDKGLSSAEALSAIQGESNQAWVTDRAVKVDTKTTADGGVAKFANIKTMDAQGRDRVLMFLETYSPADVSVVATPMVILLPVMMSSVDSDGAITWLNTYNTDVHLYPKNEKQNASKNIVDGGVNQTITIVDGDNNKIEVPAITLDKGMELGYEIKTPIPMFIQDTNADGSPVISDFKVSDTPTPNMTFVDNSLVVTDIISGKVLTEGTDYRFERVGNGFQVVLNTAVDGKANTDLLAKLTPGGKLSLAYKMLLTATVAPDEFENNTATINIGRGTDSDYNEDVVPPEKAITGGRRFNKIDGSTGNGLEGAEFILWNADKSAYAVFYDGDNALTQYADTASRIEWVTGTPEEGSKNATRIISTVDEFSIRGLAYATYYLQEVVAPDGYALPNGDNAYTQFETYYGSYDYSVIGLVPGENLEIANTRTGALPSTGGAGIIAFIVVGLGMMIGAYLWFKNSKRTNVI